MARFTTHIISSAFTLIELVYAVALSLIILSISIPQFTHLVNRQDFSYDLQQGLVACIQHAQTVARSNPQQTLLFPNQANATVAATRWTAARINGNSCSVWNVTGASLSDLTNSSIDDFRTNGKAVSSKSFSLQNASVTAYKIGNGAVQDLSGSAVATIYFGVAERGVPVAFYSSTTKIAPTPGEGFFIAVGARSFNGVEAAVTMERLGSPVKIEKISLVPPS